MGVTDREYTQIAHIRRTAKAALAENLMPFWADHTWDGVYGGFLTRLNRRGRLLETDEKQLMMQVRMIGALAAAHQYGLQERGYLDLARSGFEYLTSTFWDDDAGGFYFAVTRDGKATSTRKNTDFHAYAITGLVMYYLASGDKAALLWAEEVFDLLLAKAADRDMGFIEDFDGDFWPALNADQMNLDYQKQVKTIDMHANMLEAFMYLAGATRQPQHLEALQRLLDLICARGIHPGHGCTITAFDADWQPVGDETGRMTTSYGLNVELAWFIWEAADILQQNNEVYNRAALGLIHHALDYGFDSKRGGLAAFGPLDGHVLDATELGRERLQKSWWAQAELLNALCHAWKRTEEGKYLEALAKTFEWVYRHQMDHEFGDWFQDTDWETGDPLTTDKGREFKTAFHAARALICTVHTLGGEA